MVKIIMRIKSFSIVLMLALICLIPCRSADAAAPPEIIGVAGVLIDSESGQVLYVKEPHKHMYPASTTKVLTAIIAIESCNLSDIVTVPAEACGIEGSSIGLHENEQISMRDLVYALMLNSGNDAAVAIAIHIGGSVENFADMMNSRASALGAIDSHFENPNGLPDENHYTSAYDLSLIAKYAMKNQIFREIVSTQISEMHRTYPDAQTQLANSNRLFSRYPGTIGVKTGYTDIAGQCLIAASEKDGRELISVVLCSEGTGIYDDSIALMEYGHNEFNKISVIQVGSFVTNLQVNRGSPDYVGVTAGQSIIYSIPVDNSQTIEQRVFVYEDLTAPLSSGQKLGELAFFNEGAEFGRVDLIAQNDVSRNRLSYWRQASYVLILLVAIRLIGFVRRRSRRRYFDRRKRERLEYLR